MFFLPEMLHNSTTLNLSLFDFLKLNKLLKVDVSKLTEDNYSFIIDEAISKKYKKIYSQFKIGTLVLISGRYSSRFEQVENIKFGKIYFSNGYICDFINYNLNDDKRSYNLDDDKFSQHNTRAHLKLEDISLIPDFFQKNILKNSKEIDPLFMVSNPKSKHFTEIIRIIKLNNNDCIVTTDKIFPETFKLNHTEISLINGSSNVMVKTRNQNFLNLRPVKKVTLYDNSEIYYVMNDNYKFEKISSVKISNDEKKFIETAVKNNTLTHRWDKYDNTKPLVKLNDPKISKFKTVDGYVGVGEKIFFVAGGGTNETISIIPVDNSVIDSYHQNNKYFKHIKNAEKTMWVNINKK